jgi:hypothetical protein
MRRLLVLLFVGLVVVGGPIALVTRDGDEDTSRGRVAADDPLDDAAEQ